MHSGNIGHAQNLETLITAAATLDDLEALEVLIVGSTCFGQFVQATVSGREALNTHPGRPSAVGTIDAMELYGQAPEIELLKALLPELRNRIVVDVGAELGDVAAALLDAGAELTFVAEPAPANVARLEQRFASDSRVVVLPVAISSTEGSLDLHTSVAPDGSPLTYGHTVLSRPATDEIAWGDSVSVAARTLASLVAASEIPRDVGILKIDTEGHDLEVLKGMGDLRPEIVVVEHWVDLPHSLGSCPWTMDDLLGELEPRGFHDYAFFVHRGEFDLVQWNDDRVPSGSMGNVVFIHDRLGAASMPHILSLATDLAVHATELGEERATAAAERLALITDLERERQLQETAAAERLEAIEKLSRAK